MSMALLQIKNKWISYEIKEVAIWAAKVAAKGKTIN